MFRVISPFSLSLSLLLAFCSAVDCTVVLHCILFAFSCTSRFTTLLVVKSSCVQVTTAHSSSLLLLAKGCVPQFTLFTEAAHLDPFSVFHVLALAILASAVKGLCTLVAMRLSALTVMGKVHEIMWRCALFEDGWL